MINGGDGNNSVDTSFVDGQVVNLGKRNDSIDIRDNLNAKINAGDGNDVITGDYNISNTIHITSGKFINGNDLVLKIGTDSIIIKEAANKAITVKNADGGSTVLNDYNKHLIITKTRVCW